MPPARTSVSLCLACSSSLPPRKADTSVFVTQCCTRPICPNCIASNPRLSRYNPCLRCLAGVNAVNAVNASSTATTSNETGQAYRVNVDGSVRDEDVFVVEDGSDDDDLDSDTDEDSVEQPQGDGVEVSLEAHRSPLQPLSPNEILEPTAPNGPSPLPSRPASLRSTKNAAPSPSDTESLCDIKTAPGMPPKYFIRPDDTLTGISLKLGIDVRTLPCFSPTNT